MISIAAIPVKAPELELPLLQISKPIFGTFIVQSPLQKVVTRTGEFALAWKTVTVHHASFSGKADVPKDSWGDRIRFL
jgi:hypothetical protein